MLDNPTDLGYDESMNTRYVVKVRRFYEGREVTSVLCAPVSRLEAKQILEKYTVPYQSDQFYIEQWEERS